MGGAVGAAILARENHLINQRPTSFHGAAFILEGEFRTTSHECQGCPNLCEVVCIKRDRKVLAYWGDRCKKWEGSLQTKSDRAV